MTPLRSQLAAFALIVIVAARIATEKSQIRKISVLQSWVIADEARTFTGKDCRCCITETTRPANTW